MGRFQRTLHFQVTINFVYEILKHFKASCKDSEKHSSQIVQLNDTITYSVTASQTC